jgi:vancomycin resistance protein YoaR
MLNQISQRKKLFLPKNLGLWIALGVVVILGGILVLLIFGMLLFQLLFLHRTYPGVTIAGVPVGGMTRNEVISAINTMAFDSLSQPVTIRADDKVWTFTGQELGIYVDAAATADKAFQVGRQGALFDDMRTHLSLLGTAQNIEPVLQYDTGPTNQALQQLRDAIDYPPQDARLAISPDGTVEMTLSQQGQRIHIDSIRPQIEAALFGYGPQEITAITQQVLPTIDTQDLVPVQQQARQLLSQPFTLRLPGEPEEPNQWQIPRAEFGTMLTVTKSNDTDGQVQLSLELDLGGLEPYIDQIAEAIKKDPVDARLHFNAESDQIEVVQPSENGRLLDVPATYQQIEMAVAGGLATIDVPVRVLTPTVSSDNLEALGITALVVEQTSYFSGSSEGRMRNIALAASKFDGVIVPPGEIFSFNEQLGPVTAEEGYDESLIIFGDRTTVGIGGGVCQVSTTAFRAAFFGGFELVERWAHGYRVGWYETNSVPGLDATIYTPDVDFKFRNDTEHYLLIQTESDLEAGTLTFRFYGASPEREVQVSEPVIENIKRPPPPRYEQVVTLPRGAVKQVDWAKDGMDVTVTRVVTQGEETIHQDSIVSRYRPWQAVYQVGPGTRLEQPTPTPRSPIRPGRP